MSDLPAKPSTHFWSTFATAWSLTRVAMEADRRRLLATVGATLLSLASTVFLIWWLKELADAIIAGDRGNLLWVAVAFGIATFLAHTAGVASAKSSFALQERVIFELDLRLVQAVAKRQTIEFHDDALIADEIALVREQRAVIARSIGLLSSYGSALGQMMVALALLASVVPTMVLLTIPAALLAVTSNRAADLRERAKLAASEQERTADHLYRSATSSEASKEIRLFDLGDVLAERHEDLRRSIEPLHRTAAIRASALHAVGWSLFASGYALMLANVVRAATDGSGRVSAGELLLALVVAGRLTGVLRLVVSGLSELAEALQSAARLFRLIDEAMVLKTTENVDGGVPVERLEHGLQLEGVGLRYAGSAVPSLVDVTLDLPAGSVVAIVGENGAGKSSLVKLLIGLYRPTEGRILVDGTDLRATSVGSWRQRLTGAFQDNVNLEMVARETVGLGSVEKVESAATVQSAVSAAGADAVIEDLPRGLESQLGRSFPNGTELSGGQWQKLALARGMMRTSPVLVLLDEPSASLDPLSEREMLEHLAATSASARERFGAITIVVSHRFSTIRMADLIVVVEEGRIEQWGTHDELVAVDGRYKEMYELQRDAYAR